MNRPPFWTCLSGLIPLCLGLAACSPALNWRTVRPPDASGLEALFPCKPNKVDRLVQLPGQAGPRVLVHLLSCQAGEATWAVSYLNATELSQVPALQSAMARTLRDNLETAASLPKQPALDVQSWHFSHGLTVFQATVWRRAPRANRPDATEATEAFKSGLIFPG
ncbi:MAG: hypothetical protein KGL90_11590 [Burkholderiales bacterium]|nr:hypothetical protein [Burkholderiales bacterium]